MAAHSSVLAWRIPGTGEPGGLPSLGSHRVRHDWNDLPALSLSNIFLCFSIYADANQIACIRKQRILCPLCLILNNFCILWRSKYNTGNSLLYSSQQIKIIFFKCFNQMMSVQNDLFVHQYYTTFRGKAYEKKTCKIYIQDADLAEIQKLQFEWKNV